MISTLQRPLLNAKSYLKCNPAVNKARRLSSKTSLHRSYLYVPTSSDRMLNKSITSGSDVIIYDLEDSVSPAPADKLAARKRLREFLEERSADLHGLHVAVRVNDVTTPFFREDITQIVSHPLVKSMILPKIHSTTDLDYISDAVSIARRRLKTPHLNVIPSIESAKGMWNLGSIASWRSSCGGITGGSLSALLFAAEDYTGIIRTTSRRELLYTRSQIVITAKAFGLEAIDMVCVDFRDLDILREECDDGRQLGFTGKQAIHPSQVAVINATYVPTNAEILRASQIIQAMKRAHESQKGAADLNGKMIDAPMIKQANKVLQIAKTAGLTIPHLPE
ncbi:Citramalyl-CoA lyase, mitochondrial [Psilocybe cubensis]|uniref:Citramalyl-CoA lyase, mitochondrial n=1 Tax=Psilocybe cubensis TaxID=181762 RepID=A0ACB8GY12_PSICU|nr:Citramalyl-CoA lyase, mitochondrial [Psilocybe cubensis]KAH9480317.1 Citramalyl-CoA lyase, mitochondrial [Psilocybe cubensis]